MTRSVLIVDDDEALAENVAEIIQTLGVDTAVARDRKGALAAAQRRDFDVALIDVRLPDGDGMSLLDPMRALSPFTQLVLVTGNATLEGAIAAVRGDAFAYVLKPVSPPDLLDTVRRALDQAGLYRERERLRVDLEHSEERHRELVESMPAFVMALDDRGRIVTWNRQLEQVTGFGRDEMRGRDGASLVGADERPRDLPLKAGGARKVRWNRAEVSAAHGAPMVYAVGIDVTDEQEMLRRVLRAERLAAVGTLAAGLAHEVRNPLNSAALQLTVLERRFERGETAERITPVVRVIKGEIDRLDRLVREFLAFSKPTPFEPRPVDIPSLLAGVADLIGPEGEGAGVSVAVVAPPSLAVAATGGGGRRAAAPGAAQPDAQLVRGHARPRRPHRLARARRQGRNDRDGRRGRRPGVRRGPAGLRRLLHDQGSRDGAGAVAGPPHRDRPRRQHPRGIAPRPDLLHDLPSACPAVTPDRRRARHCTIVTERPEAAVMSGPTEPTISRGPGRWPFRPTTIRSAFISSASRQMTSEA
jgi:DNA-binding response OmpR family regulator